MKLFSLLDVQYANFANSIKNYLSKTLSATRDMFGNNTVFGQLINVLTGAVQNIMLYIEDAFVEQNKYTAQRKKSIYGLAALSGYTPSFGKAAIASILEAAGQGTYPLFSGNQRLCPISGNGCHPAADGIGCTHRNISLRRPGFQLDHCGLCRGTGKTGGETDHLFRGLCG